MESERENGGLAEPAEPPKKWVRVHHNDLDTDDRDTPISSHVIGASPRVGIIPGVPVELSQVDIDNLRNAAIRSSLEISRDSGIYEAPNPLQLAAQHYPGFTPRWNRARNMITVERLQYRFLVVELTPRELRELKQIRKAA